MVCSGRAALRGWWWWWWSLRSSLLLLLSDWSELFGVLLFPPLSSSLCWWSGCFFVLHVGFLLFWVFGCVFSPIIHQHFCRLVWSCVISSVWRCNKSNQTTDIRHVYYCVFLSQCVVNAVLHASLKWIVIIWVCCWSHRASLLVDHRSAESVFILPSVPKLKHTLSTHWFSVPYIDSNSYQFTWLLWNVFGVCCSHSN